MGSKLSELVLDQLKNQLQTWLTWAWIRTLSAKSEFCCSEKIPSHFHTACYCLFQKLSFHTSTPKEICLLVKNYGASLTSPPAHWEKDHLQQKTPNFLLFALWLVGRNARSNKTIYPLQRSIYENMLNLPNNKILHASAAEYCIHTFPTIFSWHAVSTTFKLNCLWYQSESNVFL